MPLKEKSICQVYDKNESDGVYSVPGIPFSCAYCRECTIANAHPWSILIANTACIGGLEHSAKWWKEMVEDTCKHLNKTLEEFNQEVKKDLELLKERELEEKDVTR